MAAIDKTYIDNWKDYTEIRDWCIAQGRVTDDYGNTFSPIDFLWEWEEEHFTGGQKRPIWNTPKYFDIWLIRNCPIQVIQDTLKYQYGGGWSKMAFTEHNDSDMYEQIKNRTSPYDTYERNGTKGNLKFKVEWKYNAHFKDDELFWWIDVVEPFSLWYNDKEDAWYDNLEPHWANTNTAHRRGNMSMKRLRRLLNKWNLPDGTVIRFSGDYKRYIMKEFTVTVRKKNPIL